MSLYPRWSRLLTGLLGSIVLLALVAIPQAQAQEGGGATLTIHNRICPAGFAGPDYYGNCHDNPQDSGLTFEVNGPEVRSAPTNAEGNVTFADLDAGAYDVNGGPPGDFTTLTVYCAPTSAPGTPFPFTAGDFGITITLSPGDDVICDWYNTPIDQGGNPDPSLGSLTNYVSVCPVGYSGSNYFADCYPNPLADVGLQLVAENDDTSSAITAADGFAWFEELNGTYDVNLDIPGEFASFAVYCTANGAAVPFDFNNTNGITIDIGTSDVRCDWYVVPEDLRGEEPTKTPAPRPTKTAVVRLPNTGSGNTNDSSALLIWMTAIVGGAFVVAISTRQIFRRR